MSEGRIRDGRLTGESNAAEVLTKEDCLRILEMYKDWDPGAETAEPVGRARPLGQLYMRRLNLLKAVTKKLHRILDEQENPVITQEEYERSRTLEEFQQAVARQPRQPHEAEAGDQLPDAITEGRLQTLEDTELTGRGR